MARRLHIGGKEISSRWEIFEICADAHVDHVGNANDLSRFPARTFKSVYASHVLEHFDYVGELLQALNEWHRVLQPGGRLYVSVPDMDVLAQLILQKDRLTVEERFVAMRMLFGGHEDEHDFHLVGLNLDFMLTYLAKAGFGLVRRVEEFGLFHDTSTMRFKGELVSLNLIARKLDI